MRKFTQLEYLWLESFYQTTQSDRMSHGIAWMRGGRAVTYIVIAATVAL